MEQEKISSKEQYEIKKAEREANRKKISVDDRHSNTMSSFARGVGIIGGLLVVVVLFSLWIQSTAPQTEDMSRSIEVLESPHVADGTEFDGYISNPPTSGPHYVRPAAPGFRGDESIADGHLIHSLEHGSVWVSYQGDMPETFVDVLRDIAKGDTKVVVTRRDANETDIALAAWGRLDTFDLSNDSELDRIRIQDFITRYKNRGPEQVNDVHSGV